jgi:glucosamine--fructose-6-phosphate aminotransferase (isomerizing)
LTSIMFKEATQAPQAVARLLAHDGPAFEMIGTLLRLHPPRTVVTLARGTSDHAAQYFAYLAMLRLGLPVTSMPPSLFTLHQAPVPCQGTLAIAFSQSGQSPDLVQPMRYFEKGGARTVAFVNDAASPLARAAHWVFGLNAGAEHSVAATKSYIAQLVAGARLVAAWTDDMGLKAALTLLPDVLRRALAQDWRAGVEALVDVDRLFVVGRGTGLAVAREAALKLKKTCGIQAEAFSGAEVRHGPMALVSAGHPLLVFAPRGPAQDGLLALAAEMRDRGARVLLAAPLGTPGCTLPLVTTANEHLDPIAAIQSFYPMVEALSRERGMNPDAPAHLAKITRTH